MLLRLPKLFLYVFLIGLCLLIIVFIILINLPRDEQPGNNVPPTPTSIPVPGQIREGTSQIKPRSINPPENINGNTIKNPSQKETYSLSEPVTPNEIRVRVSPSLPVKVEQGNTPSEIVVFPDPPEFWKSNIRYAITLFDAQGDEITTYFIKIPPLEIDEIRD